ncbi:MAG: CopD family protein [Parvularculaceae bacterium]
MLEAAAFASKLLLYAATLGGVGASLHRAMGITLNRRVFVWLGGAVAVTALLRLLVVNAQMGGALTAAFSADHFQWMWAGIGNQTTAFLAGAALLFVSAYSASRISAIAAALAIAGGFALAGHSAGLEIPGPAPYVVALHTLIAGFWFAAPWTLWPRASEAGDLTLHRTRMFTRIAIIVVPAIFVSGLWLLWRIGGGIDGVISSLYGRLLLGKLALGAAILGLGALNMTVVTKKLAAAPASGRKALRATLRIDAVLFLGVLLLIASATSFTGPNE